MAPQTTLGVIYGALMLLWLLGGVPTLLWGARPARKVVVGSLILLHIFVGGLALAILS